MKNKFLLILLLPVIIFTACGNPAGSGTTLPNRSALLAALNSARDLLDRTVIDDNEDNVFNDFFFVEEINKNTIEDFKEAIELASQIMDTDSATQAEIDVAAIALLEAMDIFDDPNIRKPGTKVPIDKISLDNDTHGFTEQLYGYGTISPFTITVTNEGNRNTGNLAINLTGANAGSFTLSIAEITGIGEGNNATFTVVPNTGLPVGSFEAVVTVKGANNLDASFNVSFTVNPNPITEAALTITAPEIRAPISAITSTNTNFTITTINWLEGSTIFTAANYRGGYVYTVNIALNANEGHSFTGINDANVTVNNMPAIVTEKSDQVLRLSYVFEATLSSVDIILSMDELSQIAITDQGISRVNIGPYDLDDGNPSQNITVTGNVSNVQWMYGLIPIGSNTGNNTSINLNRAMFNRQGLHTITVSFNYEGVHWLVSIELNIIPEERAPVHFNLNMDELSMTDSGTAIVNLGSFTLNDETPSQIITIDGNVSQIQWRNGQIPLGNGNEITLNRSAFSGGTHSINVSFYYQGKPWLVNFELIIIPPARAPIYIQLNMDNLVMTDEGEILLDNIEPVILNNIYTSQTISLPQGVSSPVWRNGTITLISPDPYNLSLYRSQFSPGTYSISVSFVYDNANWLVKISLTVQ